MFSPNNSSPSSQGLNTFNVKPANNVMLEMGLQYGENIFNNGIRRIDNLYVRKKLLLLLFPFRYRYPRPLFSDSHNSNMYNQDETVSEGHESSIFGQPYVSPTASYYANKNNVAAGSGSNIRLTSTSAAADKRPVSALPTQDYFSFDLYIPLMGIITYIILSAFIFGLAHHRSVTAEYLVSTTSQSLMLFTIETVAIKFIAYVLPVYPGVVLLDMASLCGYCFVLICVTVLVYYSLSEVTGISLAIILVSYILVSNYFFAHNMIVRLYAKENGQISSRARLLSFIVGLIQIPTIL